MLHFVTRHLAALLLLWGISCCCLQAQNLIFNKVAVEKDGGLGLIAGITQDKQGFLWVATHTGLYKYDGYTLTSYTNKRFDHNSLADNRLECITTGQDGMIWIGVWATGLDRLDPRTGTFTHYRHDPKDPNSLSDDLVTALLQDREGNLWVGTHKGLNLFHPETGTFTHYQYDPANAASISDNKVRALYQDRQGSIWVGTGSPWESKPEEGGLNRFNPKTGTFTRYKHDPNKNNTLVSNWVRAIYEDKSGTFWVGTHGDGLHRMDREKGTFERLPYDAAHPSKLSRPYVDKEKQNDGVNIILQDDAGAIWIGTYDSGLNRYDPGTGKVTTYQKSTAQQTGLDDNNIWAAYTTQEGTLWFGTANGNLFRLDPHRQSIPHVVTNTDVYSFYEDAAGFLLIGTSKGLRRQDLRSGAVKQFRHDPANPASISADTVYSIYKDHKGDIWLGNASGDLNKYNARTGTFTSYQHDEKDLTTLSGGPVYAMLEDSHGSFWLATGFGLDKMDKEKGTFAHHQSDPNDPGSISHNMIVSVLEDRNGYLWLGTRYGGGVNLYDIQRNRSKKYLLGTNVSAIIKDDQNVVWVATESSGIFRFDRAADAFIPFKTDLNEEVINIKSIVPDEEGNLWFGTKKGLLKVDKTREKITLLKEPYGITPKTLTFRAGYKGRDGKLYFGNNTGYYAFYPQQWVPNDYPPLITFTGLRIFNTPVLPGKGGPLNAPLSETGKIALGPDQKVFSVDFTGIHFSNPEQNKFLFKLENYDHDWRQSTDRTAAYYNVPSGNYVLRVRAANSDNVWAEKALAIRVRPHWWNTWWAYLLYGVLLAGTVLKVNRLQRRRLIRRERHRARERELVQAREIEKAYHKMKRTQAKLIQAEKMASLGELTAGIAHEIQNPLNFVNNFSEVSEELIEELEQEATADNKNQVLALAADLKENLHKIREHGKRAASIVKSMLQHSKTTTGEKEPTDINTLVDEYLRLAYHGLRAKDKTFNASLVTNLDAELEKVDVVPQELGRVLLNLFNNAFYATQQKKKHTTAGQVYEPKVEVYTSHSQEHVEIKIRDNGTGIPEALRSKVFQPFFTTKPTGQGTGLGLSISYDIITKGHGGELLVDSVEGEYTEFTIVLPITVAAPAAPVVLTSNS
ncbi:sensor histidine kinase [Pontibacter liquoris]|uniref:sensor histidine kinase n=1 Tax=Pontibacter liquoris TaxID=2905677 RepID=UPI001FA75EA8|nr:sensor histidine kinase [Pontibacter liquoris]